MIYINQFFLKILNQFKNFYLNSKFYDNKISKFYLNELIYKPSPHLLSSLIKYQKQKFKIENFSLDEIWTDGKINTSEYKNSTVFIGFLV